MSARRCEKCGEILVRRQHEGGENWKRRRFCSHNCLHRRAQEDGAGRACTNCGETLVRRPGEHNTHWKRRRFCSRACYWGAKAGSETRPLAERFWEKVRRAGPGDCWEWQAVRHRAQYDGSLWHGMFGYRGRMHYAHRIAWILARGEIPDAQHVLHRCDNPGCVNPDHLYLGTHQDNMRDMRERGRGRNQNSAEADA